MSQAFASAAAEESRQQWLEAHERFGEDLRRRLGRAATPEWAEAVAEEEPLPLDERLVQAIWNDQLLRADELRTASGKRLEVIEPGRWNTSRGPDFLGGRVRILGQDEPGDVEIHIRSADWRNHGHHQDFEYNNVVLHVSLHASDDRPFDEKQNGARLERLILEPFLEPDLDTIRRTLNPDDYPYGRPAEEGLCARQFLALKETDARAFLRSAGRARIEDKIARFHAQLASSDPLQLLYQSLMVGQGFKSNKTLYFLLSKRAPLREMMDYAQDVAPHERPDLYLSILLNVAQLIPPGADLLPETDPETAALRERLGRHWRLVRGYYADRLLPPTKRWYAGMRPPGFPGRRLAAMSILLGRLADPDAPLFEVFANRLERLPLDLDAKGWKAFFAEWTEQLTVDAPDHYFATHFTIGGKPAKPQALLGEPAAKSNFFNVLLPLAVLKARVERRRDLEKRAWMAIQTYPALTANSVTKFMKKRLFAESGRDQAFFRTELMQQALFKVFQDCCAHNERTCEDCTFLCPPYRPPG